MPNRQCAPCRSPDKTLSRTVAHDASRETSTSTPCFLYRPSSYAITTEAQSVKGMIPILILLPLDVVVIPDPLLAQALKSVVDTLARPPAATALRIKVRRFIGVSSFFSQSLILSISEW